MLNELRFVEVDGLAVALNEHPRNPVECHCWINSLDLTRLSAGNHRLHVEVFTALVWSVDLKGHELLQGLKSSDWPKAVKSWTRTADLDIRVYGALNELDSRLNKIWGKEVTFKNVPLSRPSRQRERRDGR